MVATPEGENKERGDEKQKEPRHIEIERLTKRERVERFGEDVGQRGERAPWRHRRVGRLAIGNREPREVEDEDGELGENPSRD